jgi:hypothetical protein
MFALAFRRGENCFPRSGEASESLAWILGVPADRKTKKPAIGWSDSHFHANNESERPGGEADPFLSPCPCSGSSRKRNWRKDAVSWVVATSILDFTFPLNSAQPCRLKLIANPRGDKRR